MNIADIFIRRPIMTSLIMIAIFIFGVVSYRLLPVNDLSNVDFPTIQVNANLPGANQDTMAPLLRIWSRNTSYTSTI